MAHLGKIPIEEEHHVVGELLFREPGERSEIAEQDHDLALGAVEIARAAEPVPGLGGGRQQRCHAQIAVRAKLTGEPHVGRCAHAAQHLHLFGRGRQDRLRRSADPDAAGGAAPAAAAHGSVRDAGYPARLQYRHAAHDLDHAAVRIGQADDAAPALPVPTHEPRGQHCKERRHEGVTHPHHHLIDDRGVRWCCAWMGLRELGDPGRILGHRHDLPAALEKAEDRQGRHQQREGVEDRLPALVPRLQPQPEPQSNHGVDPRDHQHQELEAAA